MPDVLFFTCFVLFCARFDQLFYKCGRYGGRGLSGLITVLEDKQYMITVREKMNNIKKVAKFYNYDFLHTGK